MKNFAAEFDKVVASQPVHAADRAQAQATAKAFLELIPGKAADQDFCVSVSGSLNWNATLGGAEQIVLTSASINVSASLIKGDKP